MSGRLGVASVAISALFAAPVAAEDFPDGPGKDIFVAQCGTCHDISRVRMGYTPDGWRQVVRMMRHMDVPLDDDQWWTLTNYLAQHFPESPRPHAVIIDGPVKISFKQWPVPTLGARPHDPLATRDGMIWYTGQTANVLGRLNPRTGDFKEFPLATPHSGPSGAAEDKHGNIWFTGNGSGIIGKLDPRTGAVTEYTMPDETVRDPLCLQFDGSGMIWFTAQQANVIGRLNPANGEIKLIPSQTANARPYGLIVTSKGTPVVVQSGTNKIATVEPATLSVKEYELPDAEARPRRLALEGDTIVWYTDFARGMLGRLDLTSGKVQEYPSPSGPKSQPYAIAFAKGAVWYTESGPKPNTVVRFDPRSHKFQSWAIPGGGDIVRNMDVMPDGNPVMASSLVNQVGLIEIK